MNNMPYFLWADAEQSHAILPWLLNIQRGPRFMAGDTKDYL